MALESKMKVWSDSKHSRAKTYKVIDCRMVVDRPYDNQSPIGFGKMDTLEVLMYPDYGETFFHKWFTEKSREEIQLEIVLLDNKGKDEEYLSVNLTSAVCYGLSETMEKTSPKGSDIRRLLRLSIKAESISIV